MPDDYGDLLQSLMPGNASEAQAMLAALGQQQGQQRAERSKLAAALAGQQQEASGLRGMALLSSFGQNPLLANLRQTAEQQGQALESLADRTQSRLASAKSSSIDPLRIVALKQAQQRLADQEAEAKRKAGAADAKAAAKKAADAQKEEQGGFKLEGNVRKEIMQSPAYKNYQIAAVALDQITRAFQDPSAAGDIAGITNFMRSLDPNTGVKDQEFNNAQNAGGMYDKAAAMLAKVQNGERLTAEQRADFLRVAKNNVLALKRPYDTTMQHYQGMAKAYKIEPTRLAPPMDFNLDDTAPTPPAGPTKAATSVPEVPDAPRLRPGQKLGDALQEGQKVRVNMGGGTYRVVVKRGGKLLEVK